MYVSLIYDIPRYFGINTLAANVVTAGLDESSVRDGHLFLATKDASIVGIQLGTHSGKLASV